MKFDVRYANHPDDSKKYDTEELRHHYLIENVFQEDDILLTYSHQDRIIVGGIMPVNKTLKLEGNDAMRCKYFLERREMAFINIGGDGIVSVDGETYDEKVNQMRLYSGERFTTPDDLTPGMLAAVTGLTHTRPGQALGEAQESEQPFLEPVLTYALNLPEGVDPHAALPKLRELEEEDPTLQIV